MSDGTGSRFELMGWEWDLLTARAVAEKKTATGLAVAPWAGLASLIPAPPTEQTLSGRAETGARHVTAIGSPGGGWPLIAVPLPGAAHLVIDGWPHLHAALANGAATLPAVILTAEDERACRTRGQADPPPTVRLYRTHPSPARAAAWITARTPAT